MERAMVAAILLVTIFALYFRPFGARDWHVALAGGFAAWLVGPLSVREGLDAMAGSWPIVCFFLGLMLLAAGAEAAGLYARAASLLNGGTQKRQVARIFLAGSGITAILSNDATPLILTPTVTAAGAATAPDTAFAVTFVADGASLLLPFSNPVNLLFFEEFGLEFGWYLGHITMPALAGLGVLATFCLWRARAGTAAWALERGRPAQWRPREFFAAATLLALAGAYLAAGVLGWPLGLVTLAGGVVILAGLRWFDGQLPATARRQFNPGLLVFVASLLLLVEAVSGAGVLASLEDALGEIDGWPLPLAVLTAAVIGMVLSNLINNWPAAVILVASVEATGGSAAVVAGTLIGCTIGANLTIVGSLSTVFWLVLTRQAGLSYSPGDYARRAFAPTLAAVTAASMAAAAVAAW